MRQKRKIAAAGVVVAVLVIVLAADAAGLFVSYPPLPLNVKTAPQCSPNSNATPLPCGFAGGGQGIFVVTAVNLTESKSDNGGGTLKLTLVNTGTFKNNYIYAFISPPGLTNYVQVLRTQSSGQTMNYTATVPTSFGLTLGQTYQIKVDSLFDTETQGAVAESLIVATTAMGRAPIQ